MSHENRKIINRKFLERINELNTNLIENSESVSNLTNENNEGDYLSSNNNIFIIKNV